MRRLGIFLVLFATGLEAQSFTASPKPLDFGNVIFGCTGTQILSITNTGTTSLDFSLSLPPGGLFTLTPATFTAQAAQKVDVTVVFKPVEAVSLTGRGLAIDIRAVNPQGSELNDFVNTAGAVVDIAVTPSSIDFGSVRVGSTSSL